MEKGNVTIDEGQVLLLTEGEYSDYAVRAVIRIKHKFNLSEARQEYLDTHYGQKSNVKSGEFIAWLSAKGIGEQIATLEVNLGYRDGSMNVRPTDSADDDIKV